MVDAARRLDSLRAAIQDLRVHPRRWPAGEHPGTRERRVVGCRVIYEAAPDTGDDDTAGDVVVLRVRGPGQDGPGL